MGHTTDIVLRPNGTVAWIAHYNKSDPAEYEVRTTGPNGAQTLDRGTDLDPRSLALGKNGTLYWTRGGETKSAVLP